jgi:hypothetical protein
MQAYQVAKVTFKKLEKKGKIMIGKNNQKFNMHKTISIITLILCTLILLNNLCAADDLPIKANNILNKQNKSIDIEWLIFSSVKYSQELNLIKQYEKVSTQDLKNGLIYIALKDLNNDGIEEIFSYIEIFNYCGQQTGCPFNIYKNENGKLRSLLPHSFSNGFPIFINLNNSGKQNMIGILLSKTAGWQDILIDNKTIWKWNGKSY